MYHGDTGRRLVRVGGLDLMVTLLWLGVGWWTLCTEGGAMLCTEGGAMLCTEGGAMLCTEGGGDVGDGGSGTSVADRERLMGCMGLGGGSWVVLC